MSGAGTRRVVYDCNVLLQAVLSPSGPAFACLRLAEVRTVMLYLSVDVISEAVDVLSRPKILKKYPRLTPSLVAAFVGRLQTCAAVIDPVARVFSLPRDPKDEKYLDLAIAAGADFLVTRDKDLLDLMDASTVEGRGVQVAYPALRVVDPVTFVGIAKSG